MIYRVVKLREITFKFINKLKPVKKNIYIYII